MANLIELPTFSDARGNLTVLDNIDALLPFKIRRVFYIYGVDDSVRGGHRHHKTRQAAICIKGRCTVYRNDGQKEEDFVLDAPNKCLLLEPQDWHRMYNFSVDAVFLVFASEPFSKEDYIYEWYAK